MTTSKETPRSYKVLVVDDNRDFSSIIQTCLEIGGYQVRTARDGEDGYRAYLLFKPDLVITDIQMPKKDGLELVRNIRAHDPNVRTIYMSGALDRFQSCLEEEKKQHQVTLLPKPFSRLQLFKLVSENIQRSPVSFSADREIKPDVQTNSKESSDA